MLFTLCRVMYEGDRPQAQFTFNAKDRAEAERKAAAWAQYQRGSLDREDVSVRPAAGDELTWQPRDEWMRR